MPTDLTPDQWTEIENHLYAGQKIAAIKVYREATGAGLKESKDVLDTHEAELRKQFPERFTASKAGGCGAAMLLVAIGLSSTIIYITFALISLTV